MRYTLESFKTTFSSDAVLNMLPSDPRYLMLLNEALQRLMAMGMWVGTTVKASVCVNQACLTWARNWETIEALDYCSRPMTLRSQWHEFIENGPGLSNIHSCSSLNAIDRGAGFAMFDDITTPSIIRLYPQYGSDAGKTVNIRGIDENGQQVLTNGGAVNGQTVALAYPFVDMTTIWGKQIIRDVIKAKTNGYVRAYSYDATLPPPPASPGASDTPLKALAAWEPSETLPDYRRSFIPALSRRTRGGCCGSSIVGDSECDRITLTVIATQKFIPVENAQDFLPLGNAAALKLAMRAIMLEERGAVDEARIAWNGTFDPIRRKYVGGAIPCLEDELESFQGDGMVVTVRRQPNNIGGSAVLNLI